MADRPDPALPVTDEEFAARLKAVRVDGDFAIAVSGGRDSMALMRLAAAYGVQNSARVLVLTVDHGLRPEALREAETVCAWAAALGLDCRILCWEGEKPSSGVQEAARNARYALLAHAVEKAGLGALLTAHSADDQAETVFMRLRRGAGARGLTAMQDATMIAAGAGAPVKLVRALLPFSRARLTATVDAAAQEYIDDPSNDDPTYERVRMRALLAALEQQGLLTQQALLQTARRQRAADKRLRVGEEELFRSLGGCFYEWGGASLSLRLSKGENGDAASGLWRRLIFAVSGETHPPDEDAAGRCYDQTMKTGGASLGGALMKTSKDRLWFLREPAAVLGREGRAPLASATLAPGEPALWDGRFILSASSDMEIKPLGAEGAAALGPQSALFSGPREGLFSAPGLYQNGVLIGAPGLLSKAASGVSMVSLAKERFGGEIMRFS